MAVGLELVGGNACEAFEKGLERDPESVRPVDVYKAIIDELALKSAASFAARCVVEDGHFGGKSAAAKHDAFLASLNIEQRRQLAEMLIDERVGGFHDVLAALEWRAICRDVELT